MMWRKRLDLGSALALVRAFRPEVSPNPGFLCQLDLFDRQYGKEVTGEIRAWRHAYPQVLAEGRMVDMLRLYGADSILTVEEWEEEEAENEGEEEGEEEKTGMK